jgi:hypothetical protein
MNNSKEIYIVAIIGILGIVSMVFLSDNAHKKDAAGKVASCATDCAANLLSSQCKQYYNDQRALDRCTNALLDLCQAHCDDVMS